MSNKNSNLFGGEGSEAYNAMNDALREAAMDASEYPEKDPNEAIYNFLENTPKTSFVVGLVNALTKMGYTIVRTAK